MSNKLSLNGKILDREAFTISPGNRAFRYGDGVFETIRVKAGHVLWSEHHVNRLIRASSVLQLIPEQEWTYEHLQDIVRQLCQSNGYGNTNVRVRLSMYRNEGGYYTPLTNKASILIEAEPLDQSMFTLNTRGISIDLYSDIKKAYSTLSALKSINSQIYVLAGIHKRNKGLGDAILLNQDERIAEATASNVFLVKLGKLYTPGLSEACVDGVMRKVIIQLASSNAIQVIESPISIDRLIHADEVFLTNAIQGIKWVRTFRDNRYGNQMSTRLTELLNKYAEQYVTKMG